MLYKNTSNKNLLFYTNNGTKQVVAPGDVVDGDRLPEVKTHKSFVEVSKAELTKIEKSAETAPSGDALAIAFEKFRNKTKGDISNLEEKFASISRAFDQLTADFEALKKEVTPKSDVKKTTREPKE